MYTPIALLEQGKEYQQVFLIREMNAKKDTRGRPYLLLTLIDVTDQIKCYVWDTSVKATSPAVQPGSYIHATIKVDDFKGQKTCVTHSISPVRRPDNLEDYVRGESDHALDVYAEEITALIDDIDDDDYRKIMSIAVERGMLDDFRHYAYGTRGPLAHIGGLIVYTLRLCRTALSLADACPDAEAPIDRSLVITSALFRNWGYSQVLEMNGDSWQINEYGRLLGVRWASAQVARDCTIDTESTLSVELNPTKKLVLQKLCMETEEERMNVLEGKILLAAERIVNAIHYTPRSKKMFKEHHDA